MRLALVVLAIATSGCAAVFKGGKQEVVFHGAPAGADVKVDGAYVGSLPEATAKVDRDRPPNIVITAQGFKEQYVHLQKKPDTPWWFWDIATCVVPVTLCIPALVDAISGAWYSYEDRYAVKLEPLPVAAPPAKTAQEPWTAPAPLNLTPPKATPFPEPTNSTEP
jgi:hypothetical protein